MPDPTSPEDAFRNVHRLTEQKNEMKAKVPEEDDISKAIEAY